MAEEFGIHATDGPRGVVVEARHWDCARHRRLVRRRAAWGQSRRGDLASAGYLTLAVQQMRPTFAFGPCPIGSGPIQRWSTSSLAS